MANELGRLTPPPGATSAKKRLGRGPGSGLGKTSGRGHKGAGARSGKGIPARFEGGQMPLQRRLPKVGFINIFREETEVVNVQDLGAHFAAGEEVSPKEMVGKGILKRRHNRVKVLAEGDLKIALTVKAHAFSQAARQKIEAAGGKAIEL
jgi:large subunit ribosomal protein L15